MRNSHDVTFTKEMRKTHTILAPQMATIQFSLLVHVLREEGYNITLLENEGPSVVQKGLKYVHNDTCYPALLVIGQMIDALDSGLYDTHKVALAITQTGGGCRASNYIHLLKKALQRSGYDYVPVLSFNLKGMNKHSGFTLTYSMLKKGIVSLLYGDTLMLLKNQSKVYEVVPSSTDALTKKWMEFFQTEAKKQTGYKIREIKKHIHTLVKEFSQLEKDYSRPVVRVGIVGEIYMKYAALGNNHLEDFLYSQSCEVMIPGIMGFILYAIQNQIEDIKLYGGSKIRLIIMKIILNFLSKLEKIVIDEVEAAPPFIAPRFFHESVESAKEAISISCKMGEGWLLTAEMRDLAALGYKNIICVQPFGCLPNHIAGKGMMKTLKDLDGTINIVPIDYDPGATKVNQENRIKLMLAVANERRIENESKREK
ncbi:MAG: 2-hydroxyglutaryl-CoA dehydratase [Spirochaetia bacterium]|nr:2-hydroxyglutaryl-CoA dehydratase [Spirochaetia bacterium]